MYSQTSDQNAFRPTTAQGSSSRRQDNKSLLSFKVKSMESIETKQNSSKDQIKALQMTLKQKCEEYVQVEQQIEQNRKEGDLMIDFVNDQIREYSMLVSVQSRGKTLDIDTLKKQKQELKNQTMQLHNQNRVALFEIDVQKQMISKLQQSKTQLKKKIQLYDDYIKKTETKFKQRQPNLDLGEMPQVNKKKPQQAIGIVQKTQDEILGEKNQLIEEYDKKIDQLTFQIQEITRTCILEKQELIKKIQDIKEEQLNLSEKILNIKLRIIKMQKMEDEVSSDIQNEANMSYITERSNITKKSDNQ